MVTIESLRFQRIDKLYIHAIDLCVYLAEVELSGKSTYLRNSTGQIARFSSRSEILDKFENIAVLEAWLVHRSAYDEMIGGPLKGENELILQLF
jgi:hypothetical protein